MICVRTARSDADLRTITAESKVPVEHLAEARSVIKATFS